MCTSPREYVKDSGLVVLGPCRTCIECRNMRREDFKQRLQFELINYNYVGAFVSLTYRDKDLPVLLPEGSAIVGKYFGSCPPAYGSTLYPPDISNFCDKMQKRLKRKFGRSGKYIAVGEYGDDNHRPHWHIIYVGLPSASRKEVLECWSKGNVDVRNVNKGAIRYVLDYIDKQVFGAKALYDEYGDFYPPFAHFSKGLGFSWINENINKFDEFGEIKYGESGKTFKLNPYLIEKYGFKKKSQYYPECVKKFARDNNIKDLDIALIKRNHLMKTVNEHKMINSRTCLYNSDKVDSRNAKDRFYQKYGIDYDEYYKKT